MDLHPARSPASPARVYLYGMIVLTNVHRLKGDFPEADGYGEIEESHVVTGGETGNSALVLARWGHRVKVAGPFLGRLTRDGVMGFLEPRGIDCSSLRFDETYDGVRDLVIVGGKARAVFGWFGRYFQGTKRWAKPERADVEGADIVGIDPFFREESEEVARICRELGRPYVTIDCPPDSGLHRGAAATVVSGEYIRGHFPAEAREPLLRRYAKEGGGLVIFTFGTEEILFARGQGEIGSFKPYQVATRSTLGAGDTFRAGVIHGLASAMGDAAVVRFAAATAACVCRRFPMAFDPPGIEEIAALIG